MRPAARRLGAPETLLAVGLGSALALSAAVPYATLSSGPVVCPFRILTGVPCPTCGMTRSWNLTAHGQLDAALAMHPLGPLAFAVASVVLVLLLVRIATGRWVVPAQRLSAVLVILGVATGIAGLARWAGLWGVPYA